MSDIVVNISIVICTFNKKEHLIMTLKSYEEIYRKVYKNFEIIICNDGGEGILELLQQYQFSYKITYYNLAHLGRANARNYGAHFANGNIILFNDDDILINEKCFMFHVEIHKHFPNSVVLGRYQQVYLTESELLSENECEFHFDKFLQIAKEDLHEKCTKDIIFQNKLYSKHWICGATGNFSISKNNFIKNGGLDTNFQGWGYEDIEFSYRLYKNGVNFYCNNRYSNFHVDHSRNKKNMIEDIKRNILYFYNKHNRANDISLYWDFLRGKISLNEFDRKTLNEITDNNQEIIYPGLARTQLNDIESLSKLR